MQPTAASTSGSQPPVLVAEHMTKSFGGVTVLRDVGFDLIRGEVHTLLGENGAGKSTLLKMLAGVHTPDSGTILLEGQPVTIPSPLAAQKLGIALIHQEPLSFPDLDVAENIFIGRRSKGGGKGSGVFMHWSAMYADAKRLLDSLGVDLNVRTRLRGLSIADQQMVELAAALSQQARVLLMDEPTAALTPGEVARLFRIVRQLRESGTAIVFISHRLEEVFEISDRITILRDGQYVGVRRKDETNREEIIQMMVGRPLDALYERAHDSKIGPPMLKVDKLTSEGRFADISFDVKAGEIVGLAGLVGAGRTDVAQTIFGILPRTSGSVTLDGKPSNIRSPRQAIDHGVAYVPEDRQQHGLLLPFSIASNITMATLNQVSSAGVLRPKKERAIAEKWRERLKIRLFDVSQAARELSGGNQQKVVLGKWLQSDPRVLLLDEPTRGIDVGAKAEVHHLMGELARQGKAILMISSDL
ncbi:MAG: sugar ABC transporter ATP-binding protein, partial [Chthoniobacterales bacterium]|nr:sugar ABC transporter ATP-binding protein [Chthoniobacterales bacterium]